MCFYFGTDIEHFAIVYLQFSGYLTLTLTGGKKLHLGMSIFTTHTYSRVWATLGRIPLTTSSHCCKCSKVRKEPLSNSQQTGKKQRESVKGAQLRGNRVGGSSLPWRRRRWADVIRCDRSGEGSWGLELAKWATLRREHALSSFYSSGTNTLPWVVRTRRTSRAGNQLLFKAECFAKVGPARRHCLRGS